MNIIKNLVKNYSSRDGHKADVIVVHISAGSLTSMTNWFSTPNSQASSHYGIGKDGTILQYVEEKDKAWTQGRAKNPTAKIIKERAGINPNNYCISIENEGQDLQFAPETQRQALYNLIIDIAQRNNIPITREYILGHYEIDSVNRPYCPSPNRSIMDNIVETCKLITDEEVCLKVPKSKLEKILKFLLSNS